MALTKFFASLFSLSVGSSGYCDAIECNKSHVALPKSSLETYSVDDARGFSLSMSSPPPFWG